MAPVGGEGTLVAGSKLISSQNKLYENVVEEKREAGDYAVQVSPPFEVNGEVTRVVLDGHHSLAAARLDGKEPRWEEVDESSNDAFSLLKEGDVDGFLESPSVYGGNDYYDIRSGNDAF